MWALIARFILRYRLAILVVMAVVTVFMGIKTQDLELLYGLPQMLPETDETYLEHEAFKARFKTESTVFVIGLEEDPFHDLELFNAWAKLGQDISAIEGVDTILSVANLLTIHKDTANKKFEIKPLAPNMVHSQKELDSIRIEMGRLPFYDDLIYNDSSHAHLMAVSLNNELFNSQRRGDLFDRVVEKVDNFSKEQNIKVRHSGLPYIRTVITALVKKELGKFVILAILVTFTILFLFFRSWKPVMVSMIVVSLGVIWSVGTMAFLGYQITILTSLIPPLVIVIGIPNCIYLINKYQSEFRAHGNKIKSLTRVVQKIGKATFITNVTTAIGFLTFVFTQSVILVEFGIVASINIILLFVISLVMITTLFSYLSPPKEGQTKHLDTKWVRRSVDFLISLVQNHRGKVYLVTLLLVGIAIYGVTLVRTTGNMVDDLPSDHQVSKDLAFFEKTFNGIMPFEVSINANNKQQITKSSTLRKIEKMQDLFKEYPQFSKSISLVEGLKFTKQAFYGGDPSKYALIENSEKSFFKEYFEQAEKKQNLLDDFIDSTAQYTRVSMKIADVGTAEMDRLVKEINPRIDSIFNPKRARIDSITGDYFNLTETDSNKDSALVTLFEKQSRIKRTFISLIKEDTLTDEGRLRAQAIISGDKKPQDLRTSAGFDALLHKAVDKQFYEVTLTGTSIVYLKGTNYLVENLFISLSLAILVVAGIMAAFFASFRMIVVSLVVNLIPLLLTAAMMGFFGITIKPSTILVFSIAFGISVDDTIHFLAKYRQELKFYHHNIGLAVTAALKETGVSMIYTSIILFCGFSVFDSSEFGGTMALGILVSFTLMIAMLANLVLLPSFLMSLEKAITNKAYKEPLLQIMDEEEDIELESLVIKPFGQAPGANGVSSASTENKSDQTS